MQEEVGGEEVEGGGSVDGGEAVDCSQTALFLSRQKGK
jgi:hypothetical protein